MRGAHVHWHHQRKTKTLSLFREWMRTYAFSNGDISRVSKWECVEWMNEWANHKKVQNRIGFVMIPKGCIIFPYQTMQLYALESMDGKYTPASVQFSFSFSFYAHITFFRATFSTIVRSYDILDVCQMTTCCMRSLKPAERNWEIYLNKKDFQLSSLANWE